MGKLKDLRQSRSMTQEALAIASSLSVVTIKRAEAGRPIAPETALSLAAVFGTDPSEFRVPPAASAAPAAQKCRSDLVIRIAGSVVSLVLYGMGIALLLSTAMHWATGDERDILGAYMDLPGVVGLTDAQRYVAGAAGVAGNAFIAGMLASLAAPLWRADFVSPAMASKLARGFLKAGAFALGYVLFGYAVPPVFELVLTWNSDVRSMPLRFSPITAVHGTAWIAASLLAFGVLLGQTARHYGKKTVPAR